MPVDLNALTRTVHLLVNGILLCFAIVMVIAGFSIALDFDHVTAAFEADKDARSTCAKSLPTATGILGAWLFLLACWGFLAGVAQHPCCLITYTIVLSMMLLCQLVIGVITGVCKSWIEKVDLHELRRRLRKDYGENIEYTRSFDVIQIKHACCGFLGPVDYKYSNWATKHVGDTLKGETVPDACCVPKAKRYDEIAFNKEKCYRGVEGYVNINGCYDSVKDTLTWNTSILIGVGFAVVILGLFAVSMAFWLHTYKEVDDQVSTDSSPETPSYRTAASE